MYESEETTKDLPKMDTTEIAAENPPTDREASKLSLGSEASETVENTLHDPAEKLGAPAAPDPALASARKDLAGLREEVTLLRRESARIRKALTDLEAEQAEFCELYPEAELASLPDEVWEQVSRGVPLAAAFALSQRRKLLLEERAAAQNAENRLRSFGTLEKEKSGFFTPDEVRAMTPHEVHEHYRTILASMKQWR